MPSPTRVSVAIVGGSLSGLMAARAMREWGVDDFVVLDRKARVGAPLKCGEAVEASVFNELFGPGERYPFVRHTADTHQIVHRDYMRPLVDVPQLTFYEVDRPSFENWLAEPVRSHLRLSTSVRSVDRGSRGFLINTNGDKLLAQCLILCCGAHYELQQQLGLIRTIPTLGYACGELHTSSRQDLGGSFLWQVLQNYEGYGWVFPKGVDGCNLGVLSFRPDPLRDCLTTFKQLRSIGTSPSARFGGRFPQNGPIPRTVGDSLLVCGDAAGMVFAATGEGIRYALLSGQMAGSVMAEAITAGDTGQLALSKYERMWQRRFGRELRVGVKAKHVIMSLRSSGHLTLALRFLSDRHIADFMLGRHGRTAAISHVVARVLEHFSRPRVSAPSALIPF